MLLQCVFVCVFVCVCLISLFWGEHGELYARQVFGCLCLFVSFFFCMFVCLFVVFNFACLLTSLKSDTRPVSHWGSTLGRVLICLFVCCVFVVSTFVCLCYFCIFGSMCLWVFLLSSGVLRPNEVIETFKISPVWKKTTAGTGRRRRRWKRSTKWWTRWLKGEKPSFVNTHLICFGLEPT